MTIVMSDNVYIAWYIQLIQYGTENSKINAELEIFLNYCCHTWHYHNIISWIRLPKIRSIEVLAIVTSYTLKCIHSS